MSKSSKRPADLPDFERPPLSELVLSVQFGTLPFKNVNAGLLWQRFAEDYPTVEEQAPIEPTFETFGPLQAKTSLGLQLLPLPDVIRYWFVSKDGNELLQVQKDRLIHNWRQLKPGDVYPRYEPLRKKFRAEVKVAAEYFREAGLGELACNQCEVSYINAITLEDGEDPNGQLQRIFTILSDPPAYIGHIERGQFNFSFVLPGESGSEPFGRLHISGQPVVLQADGKPALRLTVTARGKPTNETIDSAFDWLDMGRVAGVKGFAAVTTPEMHRLWGRRAQ